MTRCRECGGTHTPKCKPSRREDARVWRAILDQWRTQKKTPAK
jgi:hypothetical protein